MAFFGFDQFTKANEEFRSYINAKFALLELKLLKNSVRVFSKLIKFFLLAFVGMFFLFTLSIGVAVLIGEQMENMSYGFLIVAGFYLLIFLIVLFFARRLIGNRLVKKISKIMSKA